jgi:hypothetical protein
LGGASTRQGGFTLLSVLLTLGLISALLIASTLAARTDRSEAALERRLVQATALADAGLNRVAAALAGAEPLSAQLLDGSGPHRWSFAGREIAISLGAEAGKLDLNSGDPELVVRVMHAVVQDDAKAARLIERLNAARRSRRDLESVRGLLDPEDRQGALAGAFDAVFTVWTSLPGVDPRFAAPIVLRSLPGLSEAEAELLTQAGRGGNATDLSPLVARFGHLLAGSRPLYRARAEATVEGEVTVRREVLLAHNPAAGTVRVVFWRDALD